MRRYLCYLWLTRTRGGDWEVLIQGGPVIPTYMYFCPSFFVFLRLEPVLIARCCVLELVTGENSGEPRRIVTSLVHRWLNTRNQIGRNEKLHGLAVNRKATFKAASGWCPTLYASIPLPPYLLHPDHKFQVVVCAPTRPNWRMWIRINYIRNCSNTAQESSEMTISSLCRPSGNRS
jgi:hypothetical protein